MGDTTKKFEEFVRQPLTDDKKKFRPVTVIPGIGPATAAKLDSRGFKDTSHVLGQFLVLGRDKELFIDFLTDIVGTTLKDTQKQECVSALSAWVLHHL